MSQSSKADRVAAAVTAQRKARDALAVWQLDCQQQQQHLSGARRDQFVSTAYAFLQFYSPHWFCGSGGPRIKSSRSRRSTATAGIADGGDGYDDEDDGQDLTSGRFVSEMLCALPPPTWDELVRHHHQQQSQTRQSDIICLDDDEEIVNTDNDEITMVSSNVIVSDNGQLSAINFYTELGTQLSQCTSCVNLYRHTLAIDEERWTGIFGTNTVIDIEQRLQAWDIFRLSNQLSTVRPQLQQKHSQLQRLPVSERKLELDPLVPSTIYDVLCCAPMLQHHRLHDDLVDSLRIILMYNPLGVGENLLPGVVVLCFSVHDDIRKWAINSILKSNLLMVTDKYYPVVGQALRHAVFHSLAPVIPDAIATSTGVQCSGFKEFAPDPLCILDNPHIPYEAKAYEGIEQRANFGFYGNSFGYQFILDAAISIKSLRIISITLDANATLQFTKDLSQWCPALYLPQLLCRSLFTFQQEPPLPGVNSNDDGTITEMLRVMMQFLKNLSSNFWMAPAALDADDQECPPFGAIDLYPPSQFVDKIIASPIFTSMGHLPAESIDHPSSAAVATHSKNTITSLNRRVVWISPFLHSLGALDIILSQSYPSAQTESMAKVTLKLLDALYNHAQSAKVLPQCRTLLLENLAKILVEFSTPQTFVNVDGETLSEPHHRHWPELLDMLFRENYTMIRTLAAYPGNIQAMLHQVIIYQLQRETRMVRADWNRLESVISGDSSPGDVDESSTGDDIDPNEDIVVVGQEKRDLFSVSVELWKHVTSAQLSPQVTSVVLCSLTDIVCIDVSNLHIASFSKSNGSSASNSGSRLSMSSSRLANTLVDHLSAISNFMCSKLDLFLDSVALAGLSTFADSIASIETTDEHSYDTVLHVAQSLFVLLSLNSVQQQQQQQQSQPQQQQQQQQQSLTQTSTVNLARQIFKLSSQHIQSHSTTPTSDEIVSAVIKCHPVVSLAAINAALGGNSCTDTAEKALAVESGYALPSDGELSPTIGSGNNAISTIHAPIMRLVQSVLSAVPHAIQSNQQQQQQQQQQQNSSTLTSPVRIALLMLLSRFWSLSWSSLSDWFRRGLHSMDCVPPDTLNARMAEFLSTISTLCSATDSSRSKTSSLAASDVSILTMFRGLSTGGKLVSTYKSVFGLLVCQALQMLDSVLQELADGAVHGMLKMAKELGFSYENRLMAAAERVALHLPGHYSFLSLQQRTKLREVISKANCGYLSSKERMQVIKEAAERGIIIDTATTTAASSSASASASASTRSTVPVTSGVRTHTASAIPLKQSTLPFQSGKPQPQIDLSVPPSDTGSEELKFVQSAEVFTIDDDDDDDFMLDDDTLMELDEEERRYTQLSTTVVNQPQQQQQLQQQLQRQQQLQFKPSSSTATTADATSKLRQTTLLDAIKILPSKAAKPALGSSSTTLPVTVNVSAQPKLPKSITTTAASASSTSTTAAAAAKAKKPKVNPKSLYSFYANEIRNSNNAAKAIDSKYKPKKAATIDPFPTTATDGLPSSSLFGASDDEDDENLIPALPLHLTSKSGKAKKTTDGSGSGSDSDSDDSDSDSSSDDDSGADGKEKKKSKTAPLSSLFGSPPQQPPQPASRKQLRRTGVLSNAPRRAAMVIDMFGNTTTSTRAPPTARPGAINVATGQIQQQRPDRPLPHGLSFLHRTVLGWKFHDNLDVPLDINISECKNVAQAQRFVDAFEYNCAFENLLLLECWEQCRQAIAELRESAGGTIPLEGTLDTRASVDSFTDVTCTFTPGDAQRLSEHDVVVFWPLSPQQLQDQANVIANGFRRPQQPSARLLMDCDPSDVFFAKVQSILMSRKSAQATLRAYFPGQRTQLLSKLYMGSKWNIISLYSLTTVQRQFVAMNTVGTYKLYRNIMDPVLPLIEPPAQTAITACMAKYGVNTPQAVAILRGINTTSGFTLIQGPPGTGKSHTILGLIGALLAQKSEFAPYAGADPLSLNPAMRGRQRSVVAGDALLNSSAGFVPLNAQSAQSGASNKLLVCGPSNAAVDEIVKRLLQGIPGRDGKKYVPRIVRVGASESISREVRSVTLDTLIEQRLSNPAALMSGGVDLGGSGGAEYKKFMATQDGALGKMGDTAAALAQAVEERNRLREELAKLENDTKAEVEQLRRAREKFDAASQRKESLGREMDTLREQQRNAGKALDKMRKQVRNQILRETEILCCTLSSSGHEMLAGMNTTFETVIIDEAAQSVELDSLIPLKYGCRRCILVGDPNQLPPTVLSQAAQRKGYDQSLFVRLQRRNPSAVHLLSIQYRMHPAISALPSRMFYNSQLTDGPGLAVTQTAPWHSDAASRFPPFRFFDVSEGRSHATHTGAQFNELECEIAVQLVESLCMSFPQIDFCRRIGIITPYRKQRANIANLLISRFGHAVSAAIDVNTIDGFQGQEKDIIIFSCVRASHEGIGFLKDRRRINVALTRARKSLFVLGNAEFLRKDDLWGQLVDDARARNAIMENAHSPLFGLDYPRARAEVANLVSQKLIAEEMNKKTKVGHGNKEPMVKQGGNIGPGYRFIRSLPPPPPPQPQQQQQQQQQRQDERRQDSRERNGEDDRGGSRRKHKNRQRDRSDSVESVASSTASVSRPANEERRRHRRRERDRDNSRNRDSSSDQRRRRDDDADRDASKEPSRDKDGRKRHRRRDREQSEERSASRDGTEEGKPSKKRDRRDNRSAERRDERSSSTQSPSASTSTPAPREEPVYRAQPPPGGRWTSSNGTGRPPPAPMPSHQQQRPSRPPPQTFELPQGHSGSMHPPQPPPSHRPTFTRPPRPYAPNTGGRPPPAPSICIPSSHYSHQNNAAATSGRPRPRPPPQQYQQYNNQQQQYNHQPHKHRPHPPPQRNRDYDDHRRPY